MGQVNYKIPRVTDEQIHRSLNWLAAEFGGFQVSIQVGDSQLGQVTYPEPSDERLVFLIAQKSELIFHFSTSIKGVSLSYYRGGAQGGINEKSPIFDDLRIDMQEFDSERVEVTTRTIELFRPVQLPSPSDPISLLESQRAIQESSFSRLHMQLEKVFEQTIDLRSKLDEQVRGKEATLEAAFKQKESEASRQIEIQSENLAQMERDLEERRRLLDESDNTFARRQIRDRMLEDVSSRVQNFGLSQATVTARRPVAAGMGVLCLFLFLLVLLAWTSFELYSVRGMAAQATHIESISAALKVASAPTSDVSSPQQSQPAALSYATATEVNTAELILLWIRFAFLSIGLAASILYYIRWQNSWAETFATTEQSLQQFHIDVNRANWVVETCLEWRKENASDIPEPLIKSLTRGLFAGRETSATVLHPADELASALMGSASKLSLDINGNRLDIDKPGKIQKTVEREGAV